MTTNLDTGWRRCHNCGALWSTTVPLNGKKCDCLCAQYVCPPPVWFAGPPPKPPRPSIHPFVSPGPRHFVPGLQVVVPLRHLLPDYTPEPGTEPEGVLTVTRVDPIAGIVYLQLKPKE